MKQDDNSLAVSLFPMFNIMLATLGVLVFILCSVVTLSLGIDKPVDIGIITPYGSAQGRQPVYIEWNGKQLILYPQKTAVAIPLKKILKRVRSYLQLYANIGKKIYGTVVEKVLTRVKNNTDSEYILILVRPSGFRSFKLIKGFFEHNKMAIGYEPVNQLWQLRIKGGKYDSKVKIENQNK